MKRVKKILGVVIGSFIIAILCFIISIPIVNDSVANKTAISVKNIELPGNTEYIETFSKAGKLVGNGNGMQYLGGILIKSDLSLEELQSYYSQYAQNEWECNVKKQTDKSIQIVEHGTLSLKDAMHDGNYYIVYSWGDYYSIFSELDIRGH